MMIMITHTRALNQIITFWFVWFLFAINLSVMSPQKVCVVWLFFFIPYLYSAPNFFFGPFPFDVKSQNKNTKKVQ